MRTYKRIRLKGGTYFFTLTLAERCSNDLLVPNISALRRAFRQTLVDHPVKHGYVANPRDWPFSSLHRLIARGVYPPDWAAPVDVRELELD